VPSEQLRRISELRELIRDPANPNAYFRDFDNCFEDRPDFRKAFVHWEEELQGLDDSAWAFLKAEVQPYLQRRDETGRGWQQLFDILNQACAYNHLTRNGFVDVNFIPRSDAHGEETPDLECLHRQVRVFCEVKTINISDEEVKARQESSVRNIRPRLTEGFFRKLRSDIAKAGSQMRSYDSNGGARYLVFFNIRFDDFFGDYQVEYFEQIDQYLLDNPVRGIELIFRHDCPFTKSFSMNAATAAGAAR